MRTIAFVLDAPTIERILDHIGEPTQPPAVLPARSPPQLAFGLDQGPATLDWPEMDQSTEPGGGWDQIHESDEPVIVPRAPQRGGWVGVSARGGVSAVRRRFSVSVRPSACSSRPCSVICSRITLDRC
jgi:hypothetical protein